MKNIVAFINRHLTHNRDDEGDFGIRVILHVPIGFLMGIADWNNGLNRLFEFYEKNEDLHTHDEAWKDVFGAIAGWVIGRIVLTGVIIYAVIRIIQG